MARKGLKVSTASAAPTSWSVADFGVFYTENAAELRAHATRILKDTNRAEEVVQDALIKFMLAAPELSSAEHALGYLHRTIENLCVDIFRLEGRRPNLVVLDDAQAEIEANWIDNEDHADVISAADDAAIIRQALALLSPAERTALVMWEMEGRTTEEIASALNIKESAVRHTLSRARASMRRILTEIVIDEERGLTALDMLSTTYKRAGEIAKKSSSVALSLVLVMAAFLGFNSMTGNESNIASTKIVAQAPAKPAAPSASATPSTTPKTPTAPADVAPTAEAVAEDITEQTPVVASGTSDAEKFQTFSNQVAAAKEDLAKAQRILNNLKKEDRERLARLEAERENKILNESKKYAQSYKGDNTRGSIALKYALAQIGDVYVWAAAGPTRWDCSGLTMRAFQASGVSLPHSSRAQANYGKSIARNKLLPGDLVFFGKPISHVGIYLGGGKMVHAPRPGARVKVVSFGDSLGSKRYVGARRL